MSPIRPATLLDLELIFRIEEQSYPSPWSYEFLVEELCNSVTSAYVMDHAEQVIGYIFFHVQEGNGHLNNIAVHPEFRRQGYGQELLLFVLHELEREGCRRLFLEVRPQNLAAIALYQKHGFLPVARQPDYYASGEDALILMKELSRSED